MEDESPTLETAEGGMSAGLSIRMCSQFRMDALDDGSECTAASERGGSAGSLPSGYLCDLGALV